MQLSMGFERLTLLGLTLLALVISGLVPSDRLTWFLEVTPIFIGFPILIATARRFPLTSLAYRLVFLHALVLMVGGHYTYAEVPLGFWLQDWLDLSRNPYDRIGHLFQGFVPAILAREILLRLSPLQRGKLLFFLVVCICLAVSAIYELLEWASALALGQDADAFLGTQGDMWDTQEDMFMALLGANAAQILLPCLHDRHIAAITPAASSCPAGRLPK